MNRQWYLDIAARGLRVPVGVDLVLRERSDAEEILRNGKRLAAVIIEAATRYRSPLAFPVMDLMLEKAALLGMLGITGDDTDSYHFDACPDDAMAQRLEQNLRRELPPRMRANCEAITEVAHIGKCVPIGMSIGPVSLMTKLLADPITPIFLAGSGVTGAEDEEIRTLERVLEFSTQMVLRSVEAQIQAGAKAIFIAEPTANIAYFSPKQLEEGAGQGDTWDRYVMASNRRVKNLLDKHGVDLIFHCCGDLVDPMVRKFATLDPAILSLGSSRKLWQDATLVPERTVLYGNLPTKKFFADSAITREQVAATTCDLIARMRTAHHPFILGSECDVLNVPGSSATIRGKIEVMLTCN